MISSDLYLPECWANDRERCRKAGIPDEVGYRPMWRIGLDQVREAIGNGVRFAWLTFDEEMDSIPAFWFGLDGLGQRARQEAGFGASEVRTYTSLIRHWLCSRLAMLLLAEQTHRLRGKNPRLTLEQVARAVDALVWKLWRRSWNSWAELIERCACWQRRNEASYRSRRGATFPDTS